MFELLHNGAKLGIIFHIKQILKKKKQLFSIIDYFFLVFI